MTPPEKIYLQELGLDTTWNADKINDDDTKYIRADTVIDPDIVEQLVEALKPFAELSEGMKEIVTPYERGMDLEDLTIYSNWLIDAKEAIEKYESPCLKESLLDRGCEGMTCIFF